MNRPFNLQAILAKNIEPLMDHESNQSNEKRASHGGPLAGMPGYRRSV